MYVNTSIFFYKFLMLGGALESSPNQIIYSVFILIFLYVYCSIVQCNIILLKWQEILEITNTKLFNNFKYQYFFCVFFLYRIIIHFMTKWYYKQPLINQQLINYWTISFGQLTYILVNFYLHVIYIFYNLLVYILQNLCVYLYRDQENPSQLKWVAREQLIIQQEILEIQLFYIFVYNKLILIKINVRIAFCRGEDI
eukprot:TRINITY_DN734_c0_g1_i3.p5 TRINITY_DN734_c0_g1~~TRINITY_DN734_c0_g1_i3.p5  ORF type:complete len:197 (-),score=-14.81 TRINITY_DN734_c0_g1_i3:238-828(-)